MFLSLIANNKSGRNILTCLYPVSHHCNIKDKKMSSLPKLYFFQGLLFYERRVRLGSLVQYIKQSEILQKHWALKQV